MYAILTKLEFGAKVVLNISKVKFYENKFSGSRVFPCEQMERETGRRWESLLPNFAKASEESVGVT
jgi:hypothetical protein